MSEVHGPESDREKAREKLLKEAKQFPGVREAQELYETSLKGMGYAKPAPPRIVATDHTNAGVRT